VNQNGIRGEKKKKKKKNHRKGPKGRGKGKCPEKNTEGKIGTGNASKRKNTRGRAPGEKRTFVEGGGEKGFSQTLAWDPTKTEKKPQTKYQSGLAKAPNNWNVAERKSQGASKGRILQRNRECSMPCQKKKQVCQRKGLLGGQKKERSEKKEPGSKKKRKR